MDITIEDRLAALDVEQKVRLLTGADFWSLHDEPAIGLRRIVTSDGPAGVRGERWDEREPSANVPSPTLLAATWDEARIERLARLLAGEARRKGVDVVLAPMVNLHRTPYGGRHFESFSEDPLLTARIGAAYVRGLQAEGVAATVKHFVANDSEAERFTADVRVSERALRELYAAPFETLVREAGAWTVMAAYNAVGGTTMTESPLLQQILRDEWEWDGLVMSDWLATRSTAEAANAALDLAMPTGPWGEALLHAVREGRVSEAAIDAKVRRLLRLAARVGALDGVPPAAPRARPWSAHEIAEELRATAAAGFVLARNESGALPLAAGQRVAVLGPSAAVARTLGGGSATVFPPYTVSPLDGLRAAGLGVTHAPGVRVNTRIPPAILPGGVEVRFLGADGRVLASEHRHTSTFTWLGLPVDGIAAVELRARMTPEPTGVHVVGLTGAGRFRLELAGRELFDGRVDVGPDADPGEAVLRPPQWGTAVDLKGGEEVELVLRHDLDPGAVTIAIGLNAEPPHPPEDAELEHAVVLAREADAAVVVIGTNEEVECEGVDRESLALPGRQDELVERVAEVNPRTVVVVNAGAPVLLPWADRVAAVLLAWFPGQEFGHALADVLLGAAEPGGRLPTTWPASEAGLPSTRPVDGVLAYEEGLLVGYRDPRRDALYPFGHGLGYTDWEYLSAAASDGEVAVRLRNAGGRRGREVVQVYASRRHSAVERPPRWLAGFAAVEAEPGEEVTVRVDVPAGALAHWDGGWTVEPGTYTLEAGRSSRDLRVAAEVTVPNTVSP